MQARQITMEQALAVLDLTHSDLEKEYAKIDISIQRESMQYFEEANKIYQRVIKEAHRKKAFELHPDRCKEADANEKCGEVNFMAGELLKLKLMPRPQPVIQQVFVMHNFGGFTTSSTTSSTASWGTNGGATWFVNWEK